jgi:dienelactone hydrolase
MDLAPFPLIHGDTELTALVARPAGPGPFPAVLVMHSALGIHHQVQDTARRLAALGYLAVATDMYGPSAYAGGAEGPGLAYAAFAENPELLRARSVAWFEAVRTRPDVDAGRIAAIGYCFGGHCVLELARSGAEVRAVCSYHGILTTHAPAQPGAVKAHVAAFCGAKDPYAPMADITALRKEMEAAGASWQLGVYGDAEHGFTDPDAARLNRPGIAYDAHADKASWAATLAILEIAFK